MNILVIRLSSLGDVALAGLLVRRLRDRFSDGRIDFLAKQAYAPLLTAMPELDNRLALEDVELPATLSAAHYDAVIDLQNNLRSRRLVRRLCPSRLLRYHRPRLNRFARIHFPRLRARLAIPPPVALDYLAVARPWGVTDDGNGVRFRPTDEGIAAAREHLERLAGECGWEPSAPLLIAAPGGRHATKIWPADRWARLLTNARAAGFGRVVLVGSVEDADLGRRIAADVGRVVANLCGRTSLDELIGLISLGAVLVSEDSGPLHIAEGMVTPVVAIFGPTVPEFGFAPFRAAGTTVQVDGLACRPCHPHGPERCPKGHFRCMLDIEPQAVLVAILQSCSIPKRLPPLKTAAGEERRGRFGLPGEVGGGWFRLYDALAPIGVAAARLAALFHYKLRTALNGRRGGVNRWQIEPFDARPSILLHVASRGEFEAVHPLIDRLLERGDCRLAVSFSSPSVEPAVTAMEGLWARGYLPLDLLGEQLRFLSRLEPSVILVSKHDFWPNMVRAAATLGIPFILLNANFHARSRRQWPPMKGFNRAFMAHLSAVWAVSEDDAARVRPLLTRRTELASVGDTRYDRALRRTEEGRPRFADLASALGRGPVIIAGSSWPPEERLIWPAFAAVAKRMPATKLVIVPHELTAPALSRNRAAASSVGMSLKLFSDWRGGPIAERALYVDEMGVLAGLYAVGWTAFVGGGFGKGVHSVLEPAAHGLPVTFGPNHHVAHEAGLLLKAGGGFIIKDAAALERLWMKWLDDPDAHRRAADAAKGVVASRAGATDRVLERLAPYITAL